MTKIAPTVEKPKKVNARFQREKDNRLVKGRFVYNELPGGVLAFNYLLHKGDKPIRYVMHDGGIYTVPLSVARHLNKNVAYPVYDYIPGEDLIGAQDSYEGKNMRVKRMEKRCSFEPLDFIADEELQGVESDVVSVETV